ncbi:MAG: hypothetical protein LBU24_00825 [Methanocalculaceae archaeon]|jgi:hypothetical protein|nr:hypothetical protein [Methanocalculaceae archaeon]
MKKSTALAFGILFGAFAVTAALFVSHIPALITVVVISVPAAMASLIYWLCAGTKKGDIPFVGY